MIGCGTEMIFAAARNILVSLREIDEDSDEESMSDAIDRNWHSGHHHRAYSFHHFSGPVIGHHDEIFWKDKHGHQHHDYKAYPKYEYSYGVEDHHTRDQHGQQEYRDGEHT